MEPNKLENDFRDKLGQRTLQPSPMAWDRLDAMLSVAEEKKKPKKRTWMYMAASFLGLLLMGTLFLKQGSSEIETTIKSNDAVVVAPSAKSTENTETTTPVIETVTETPATISNQPVQVAEVKHKRASANTVVAPQVKNEILPAVMQNNEAVAENIQEKSLVNDADKLLAESLAQNQRNTKRSIKVDSKSLLSSVEGELDQSFKEKAFNGAVKNFNAIKTSVANRNHR